jgi:putative glutamine amidotransferase
MKRLISLLLIFLITLSLAGQDFFREEFNKNKTYILLANPTEGNLNTINYLVKNKLLKVKASKVKFVGIYHEDQNYNFNRSKNFIRQNKLSNFYLHEVKGKLNTDSLFSENNLSASLKELFNNSAGTIFFGGPDIPPKIYNQKNIHSKVTDPNRHYFELTFLFHLIGGYQNESLIPYLDENPDYFITGFCLGLQTMNVAAGGTLIQDIPSELFGAESADAIVKAGRNNLHRNYWQELYKDTLLTVANLHPVQFKNHPFFNEKVNIKKGITPLVYSSHHQAIRKLGKDMEITALSNDEKIIEAVAHRIYPHVFSVQFHPEVPALFYDAGKVKFHPDDLPLSINEFLGKESLDFHKQLWKYISRTLKKAVRAHRSDYNIN